MVQTVRGPITPEEMGNTFCHEHLLFAYPGWDADRTVAGGFHKEAALQRSKELLEPIIKEFGLKTIIDATPNDCGREPEFLREVSEMLGINIVCSTGFYNQAFGGSAYYMIRSMFYDALPEIYELLTTEITEGIQDTGIKAGVIKVGAGAPGMTDYEKMVFTAAAKASRDTGTVIITHSEAGCACQEQAELLISEGADPSKIQIGHVEASTDIDFYLRILDTGVYIAFDRCGVQHAMGMITDEDRIKMIGELVKAGYADRILLSQDYIANFKAKNVAFGGEPIKSMMPNYNWNNLFRVFIPALKEAGVSDSDIRKMMIENPGKLYG